MACSPERQKQVVGVEPAACLALRQGLPQQRDSLFFVSQPGSDGGAAMNVGAEQVRTVEVPQPERSLLGAGAIPPPGSKNTENGAKARSRADWKRSPGLSPGSGK